MNYTCDTGRSNTIHFRQCSLAVATCRVFLAYLLDLGYRELGVAMRLSVAVIVASLRDHVMHIVCGCTDKQMCRINASRVIAPMADKQAIWNRPIMQFPAKSMGKKILIAPYAKMPIALYEFCRLPLPAFIGAAFIDLAPKTLGSGTWGFAVVAGYEVIRFSTSRAATLITVLRDACFLSTTTMAITVRDFVRGMIHDVVSASNAINHATGHFAMSPWRFYWGCYRCNCSTFRG